MLPDKQKEEPLAQSLELRMRAAAVIERTDLLLRHTRKLIANSKALLRQGPNGGADGDEGGGRVDAHADGDDAEA